MTTRTILIISIAIASANLWHMGLDIHLPSIPAIAESFNTSISLVQLTVTVTIVAFGLSQLFYGPLSDYYGRRGISLIGLFTFAGASLGALFAPSIELLILARFLQGIGLGCAGIITGAMLRDMLSGKELIKVFSYLSIAISLSPLLAPVLGGYIQEYIGWRANFGFLLLYGIGLLLFFFIFVPETNQHTYQGSLQFSTTLKNYKEILFNTKFLGFIFSVILIYSGEVVYLITTPAILQQELSLSPAQNGYLIALVAAGLLIGAGINSYLITYYSSIALITAGAFIILASTMMFSLLSLFFLELWTIVIPMFFYMFGVGFIFANCFAGTLNLYPNRAGIVGSLQSTLLMLSVGIISVIAGYLPQSTIFPLALFLLFLSLVLIINVYYLIRE